MLILIQTFCSFSLFLWFQWFCLRLTRRSMSWQRLRALCKSWICRTLKFFFSLKQVNMGGRKLPYFNFIKNWQYLFKETLMVPYYARLIPFYIFYYFECKDFSFSKCVNFKYFLLFLPMSTPNYIIHISCLLKLDIFNLSKISNKHKTFHHYKNFSNAGLHLRVHYLQNHHFQ